MSGKHSNTSWLRAETSGRPIGADREAKVLRGFVVAQEGPFKTQGRGEFDLKSLKAIRTLMAREPKGLKSRFTHPDLSSDGLGKFLGRAKRPTIEEITVNRGGDEVRLQAVRADLHFVDSAFNTPSGDLAGYVMDLADDDADAMSSSLVLARDEEYRLEKDGTRKMDEDGEPLPPLWRPTALHASDIVDTGDAVDGLLAAQLSADGLPDEVVRQAAALLKQQFDGKNRDFVEPRLRGWCDRVLSHYWSVDEDEVDQNNSLAAATATRRRQLSLLIGD